MQNWKELSAWRNKVRRKLLARRQSLSEQQQMAARQGIEEGLRRIFAAPEENIFGFYWPYQGEIDLRDIVSGFITAGGRAALPVVVEKNQPLEFWEWRPDSTLRPGIWDIPVPAEKKLVNPTVLLVPLLGFDVKRYRLGYGAGYYDRTLAIMRPVPVVIGIGFEMGRLDTIYPQLHDCQMDAIVTEYTEYDLEFTPVRGAKPAPRPVASTITEPQPEYPSHLDSKEVISLLVKLLETERAGARSVLEMAGQANGKSQKDYLIRISKDEALFCEMLTGHIERLGGDPGSRTGPLFEKLIAVKSFDDRMDILNRGQGWVAHKLRETLPRIDDDALSKDLKMMLDAHERNIGHWKELQPAG